MCLAFLEEVIKSIVPKAYLKKKKIRLDPHSNMDIPRPWYWQNLLVKMVLWLVDLISFPQLKQVKQRRHI